MAAAIWIGAAVTVLGLAGLLWCIRLAVAARAPELDPQISRAMLQKAAAWNMAAVAVAGIGLMLVLVGIILR